MRTFFTYSTCRFQMWFVSSLMFQWEGRRFGFAPNIFRPWSYAQPKGPVLRNKNIENRVNIKLSALHNNASFSISAPCVLFSPSWFFCFFLLLSFISCSFPPISSTCSSSFVVFCSCCCPSSFSLIFFYVLAFTFYLAL